MTGRATILFFLRLFIPIIAPAAASGADNSVPVTILHTNDFHGHLYPDPGGQGGVAYLAGRL